LRCVDSMVMSTDPLFVRNPMVTVEYLQMAVCEEVRLFVVFVSTTLC
jgi:hypothetical protein